MWNLKETGRQKAPAIKIHVLINYLYKLCLILKTTFKTWRKKD